MPSGLIIIVGDFSPETIYSFSLSTFSISFSLSITVSSLLLSTPTIYSSSLVIIGDTPCIAESNAFDNLISDGVLIAFSTISLPLHSRIHSLSCFGGSSYLIFGKTNLWVLIVKSTRFSASTILSFSSIRIMLLYLPIISTQSVSLTLSPSSLVAIKSRNIILSSSICLTSTNFAPPSLFLSSIQSIGGVAGFSIECSVKQIRGEFALEDTSNFLFPFFVLSAITSSSLLG